MDGTTHAAGAAEPITDDEWYASHFDYLSPELAQNLHEMLGTMRHTHPVAHSDAYGGYWIVTRYDDVLRVAQDWETFSSERGVSIIESPMIVRPIPEISDPPIQRAYKRLINAYFTPAAVAKYEQPTRDLVTRMIDEFVEDGRCEFMEAFARPFPGLLFFDQVLNAPSDEVLEMAACAAAASTPNHPKSRESWQQMFTWITDFLEQRRRQPPKGDVVDAILAAEIEGRPITQDEIVGLVQLLILGGLETTAGALGHFFIRFCHEPEIPALLRAQPQLIPDAVEELLRLEGPFIAVGRTVTRDAELDGHPIKEGDKVLMSWASANRDEAEFACPHAFDLSRASNRHLAFGAGPHRCAGSNLARLNLRVALEELLTRLDDIELQDGVEPLPFHSVFNRSPLVVPITFTPGPRVGANGGKP